MNIRRVPIDSIHEDPANVRMHPARNLEAVKASLARFGQQRPILIDSRGVIRAGNATHRAAKALGWTQIDVVETNLQAIEATAFAIADNRTAELAAWNEPDLAAQLRALQDEDAELLAAAGYAENELAELLLRNESLTTDPDETDIPEPPDVPRTQRGDVIQLGAHRLMCGDSSSREDLKILLGGQLVHLVISDPPYNVNLEPRSNNAIAMSASQKGRRKSMPAMHHQNLDLARHPEKAKPTGKMRAKDRPLVNDFISEEEFDVQLRAWYGNAAAALEPGRSFYIWGGYSNLKNYPRALEEAGLYLSQTIIWHKQWPVLTRKDFMGDHEWCFYGWREGGPHYFNPEVTNATDLWQVRKVTPQSMVHLTEKPVELAERAMHYSSRPGERVLDLFGGSGWSLLAAQRMERQGFLMELDPAYCDVIVERWEKMTARSARRA